MGITFKMSFKVKVLQEMGSRTDNINDSSKHGKVQVGKDQEKAQSEKDSHSKNRGGKKPN